MEREHAFNPLFTQSCSLLHGCRNTELWAKISRRCLCYCQIHKLECSNSSRIRERRMLESTTIHGPTMVLPEQTTTRLDKPDPPTPHLPSPSIRPNLQVLPTLDVLSTLQICPLIYVTRLAPSVPLSRWCCRSAIEPRFSPNRAALASPLPVPARPQHGILALLDA
ncbi:hypothetical protein NMY22_g8915 [Coprinellus aureogranulatus]|nr:hypothetical protein NMY22_g8915 [Coprinellus aureogranulatus]